MNEQNPYAYGYARMPRIIRKGYTHLTKMQKLLYIYLRDLCGEDGTCYRSLRNLAQETDFSIGYLSENIPLLHNEGLIHAEMRKTPNTHWEVWHITITDIWEKNATFLQGEKCSPDEQMKEQSVQDMNKSVHQMNRIDKSVHTVNESVHAMTLNKNTTKNQTTENQEREESVPASSSQPPLSQDAIALATPSPVFVPEEKEKERPTPTPSQPSAQTSHLPQASDMTPTGKEQPAALVQQTKVTQASTAAKPARKPKVAKEGVSSPERIEAVFVCMDTTIRRLTKQEDFTFGRTKKAREAIRDLLSGRSVSPEKLDWHITRLWNKPKDERSGFYWRENLSVVAICNNYDREIVNYKPPLHVVPPPVSTEPPIDKSKIFSMKPLFHLAPKPPLRRLAQAQKAEVAP